MNDLISRQAAIDALDVLCQEHRYKIPGKRETYSQYNETWQDALDRAEGAIFNLPSAQPEERALHESCTDCPLYDKDRHSCPRFNKVIPETLRELQSAQPERETAKFIRWMECKKTANYISYTPHCKCSKCGTEFLIETVKYCYMCGARMER